MATRKRLRNRAKKKIKSNCWNLDDYLNKTMLEHIKVFKDLNAKHPMGGYPSDLKGINEWQEILGDIIYFLEQYEPMCEGVPENPKEYMEYLQKLERERHTLRDDFVNDSEREGFVVYKPKYEHPKFLYGMDVVQDKRRYRRGMIGLLKYFSSLWI